MMKPFKEIIKERCHSQDLLTLSERSDFRGNVFEVDSTERCDHNAFATLSTLFTSRKYKGNTPKILENIKSLQFFEINSNAATTTELHKNDQLAELILFFNESIGLYFEEMSYDYETFEITHCWANKSKKSQGNHEFHYHPNSFLSGIFYLTSGGGGSTVFKSDQRPQLTPNIKKFTKWNSTSFEAAPIAGKLVLFPSHLDHKTTPHTDSESARYSIAFKVMIKGF